MIILLIPVGTYVAFFIPAIQQRANDKITGKLAAEFGTPVTIGSIHYRLFRSALLTDFLIRDNTGDTLIFAATVKGQLNLKLSSLVGKSYVFDRLNVSNALVRFIASPGKEPNYASFFDSFKKDSTHNFWPYVGFRQIQLENARLVLINGNRSNAEKVDFRDLEFQQLNAEIRNLEVFKQQTRLRVRNLAFHERSGWQVKGLDTNIEITPENLNFNRIRLIMPNSGIHADYVHMHFNSFQDFKDFSNKVNMDIWLKQSALGYHDMTMFLKDPSTIRNNIFVSGKLNGTVSDIQVSDLRIQSGFESEFMGDIEAIGLPDIQNCYLFINVNRLSSSIRDLQTFYWPGTHKQLSLPENIDAFGNISYSGNFTGFITDFVSYGKLTTDIGRFSGDLSFKTDTLNQLVFQGQLNTYALNLGKLIREPDLAGQMTMNMHVDGHTYKGKKFRSSLQGIIDSVELNHYMFHHVKLDGQFTEKAYDGSINIEDNNLRLDFAGLVDFTSSIPEFDFSLNIPRANLFPLHIDKTDSSAFFSTLVLANFTGSSIDSLNGRINVLDATLRHENRQLSVYDISVKALADSTGKSLQLGSTYAEGTLQGKYDFSKIKNSMRLLLSRYFPSTFSPPPGSNSFSNDFTFQLTLTNPEPFRFFLPGLNFTDDIKIGGRYSPEIELAQLTFDAPDLTWDKMELDHLSMEAMAERQSLRFALHSDALKYNGIIAGMKNLQTDLSCEADTINTYLSWNDVDSTTRHTSLHFTTSFNDTSQSAFPEITVTNDATRIWINNAWWQLSHASIIKDSTMLQINNLILSKDDRLLGLNGILSNEPGDTMSVTLQKLDLSSLNRQTRESRLNLQGLLDGTLQVTGGWNNPLFFSAMDIRGLSINDEDIGDTRIHSHWDTLQHTVNFNIASTMDHRTPVYTAGTYSPATKQLTGDVSVDSINLKMFSPFTSVVFPELSGYFSGKVHIRGPVQHPLFSGELSFQHTAFTVAYINTRYNFSATLPLKDNIIGLNGITLYDIYGNTAVSTGSLSVENISQPSINLRLNARNISALNIQERDNDVLYGSATGSGVVAITGPFKNISLNISATTGDNTHIYLPLGNGQSISTVDFISFVTPGKTETKEKDNDYPQNSSGSLNMNLDLKVTPVAEVTIIMDPSTGEALHSRGHGDLQMSMKRETGFSMYGEYTIDEGDYLFTLENIISKKFRLENGGTINFNGDPLNAELDVNAIYPVKTSLYQLLYDENYQRRIPVECQIHLTGRLQQPNIGFDITLPTADEDTRTKVKNAITSQEELSKQFLSLLIINSFYPDPSYGQPGLLTTAGTIGATTTEMLSNQLSNWLSQISNDFDIGFSYHPGDEVTSEQVEVALSTQLLNDRVSINGNVDFKGQQTSSTTNNIVGDFQIEVKLTENGKFRVKAFTRANDKFLYETAPYTNGIGIFYREEFDSWDQLMSRYWNRIVTGKNKD